MHTHNIFAGGTEGHLPNWVEPPGSSGYKAAQLSKLRHALLWAFIVLVMVAILAWPFIQYQLEMRHMQQAMQQTAQR